VTWGRWNQYRGGGRFSRSRLRNDPGVVSDAGGLDARPDEKVPRRRGAGRGPPAGAAGILRCMNDFSPPAAAGNEPAVLTNELARERNREAADRTLLAWIRTSLALISLGFGIERLGQAAVGLDGRLTGYNPLKTRIFGATLILLGVAATLAGMWEHRHVLRAIARVDYRYAARPAIARFMGAALVVVGLVALVVVLAGA